MSDERLKVLVADDEQLARARLTRLLSALPEVQVVGECADGDEVLSRLASGGVDLVLLDIQMPKLKGTEALALWPKDGPMVVFCTAHAEHAVTAFDGGAVDYLLKPVEPARLKKALDRAREKETQKRFQKELSKQREAGLPKLPVTTRQGVVLLDFDAITHAVLEDELVAVHTEQAQYLSDFTLQQLVERLPAERFERVHRRAVVNLAHVVRLEPLETGGYLARMRQGSTVEVSRQSARDLRKRLGLRKAGDD